MDEEWRVSLIKPIQLAGGKPLTADAVRDRLRSRAGEEVSVSVTAARAGTVFLYAEAADAAATAEGMAREVLAELGAVAEIRVERWDPSDKAWLPAGGDVAAEMPSGQEGGHRRRRLRAAGTVLTAILDRMGTSGDWGGG